MSKDERAQHMYEELCKSTYAKQIVNKDGKSYEIQAVIRSIIIKDLSCDCIAVTDGPENSIQSIKELL